MNVKTRIILSVSIIFLLIFILLEYTSYSGFKSTFTNSMNSHLHVIEDAQIFKKYLQLGYKKYLLVTILFIITQFLLLTFINKISAYLTQIKKMIESFPSNEDHNLSHFKGIREADIIIRELQKLNKQIISQSWINSCQLEIATIVRGNISTKETASNIVRSLCKFFDAPIGAYYEVFKDNKIKLLTGFSINGKINPKKLIKIEDTIFSDVFHSNLVKVDNNLPSDYSKISSALGETSPSHRMIIPISIEKNIIGLIEIAGMREFVKQDIELAERVIEGIGLSIIASSAREEEVILLDKNKTQLEELKAFNLSLEEKTRELEESENILQAQTIELETANNEMKEQSVKIEEKNQELKENYIKIKNQAEEISGQILELEKANKYKSEFLANMSHELRTPLNSLLILSKSLYDNSSGNLTDEQTQDAKMIYDGGQELLKLINDVLDFAKIESNTIVASPELLPVKNLLQNITRKFKPLYQDKKLDFEITIDKSCPSKIFVDEHYLNHILSNLISNSIKFTEKGSVKLELYSEEGKIFFTVSDTGIGIEKENLQAIFDVFKQEDGSVARMYGGTGLGLAIVKKLTKILGGEVSVESSKGIGSKFTFYLPINKFENPPQTFSESSTTNINVIKYSDNKISADSNDKELDIAENEVLIIEDDPSFARILANISEKHGYHPVIKNNGKEGFIYAETKKPSAIILDLILPDIDGIQIFDQLKDNIDTRHIPVHIVSGRDLNQENLLQKGAAICITKPIIPEAINILFNSIRNISQKAVKNILLIHHDKKQSKSLVEFLENKTIKVSAIASSKDAIKILSKNNELQFDSIILDINITDMKYSEFLSKMEEINKDSLPPIIIYSPESLTKSQQQTISEYKGSTIVKGVFTREELIDEVTLFLHSLKSSLSEDQKNILQSYHDPNKLLIGKKILIADDDMRNLFAISKSLSKYGIKILQAENGEIALEKLEESDVDCVIMDIMMPKMDGYEAIKKIRQKAKYTNLPIIALTALTMKQEKEKSLAAGANDYITKPVDMDKLLALIKILLF